MMKTYRFLKAIAVCTMISFSISLASLAGTGDLNGKEPESTTTQSESDLDWVMPLHENNFDV